MTPLTRLVIAVAMLSLPLLVRAEGKCNDDPFLLPDGRTLAVAWTIPVPESAVSSIDSAPSLMNELDGHFPVEPSGFPAEYASNVWRVSYPGHPDTNKKITNQATHKAWLEKFGLAEGPVAASITSSYLAAKYMLFGVLLQHPPVPDRTGYEFCTCILQRAVLLWDDKQEQLWFRTRFRSAKKDKRNWTNFEPASPIKFTFTSPKIWFPLAYNEVLPEPPAFLVLDVVTLKPIDRNKVPSGFTIEDLGQVGYDGKNWAVSRLRRRYEKGERPADLSLPPP